MADVPEQTQLDPSAICSLGPRPILITGFLVKMLQQHFADPDNIDEPTLRSYTWSDDPKTRIVIESVTRRVPDFSGKRLAVLVRRNDWTNASRGINDAMMGTTSIDGSTVYESFIKGSHTLFCLARAAGQAEILTSEIYKLLLYYSPEIRKQLRLHRFRVAQVSRVQKDSSATEAKPGFFTSCTVAYTFTETWRIRPNAPKLKRIIFEEKP